jgi:methenyltetrahydromethanopterin cyclohydrolase
MPVSVNRRAATLTEWGIDRSEELGILVEKHSSGATIVDLGIKAKGGFLAGKLMTEVCLGDLGKASFTQMTCDDIDIPAVHVETDHPAVATLGAQFAGWQIKTPDYFAMGSGPARALALKPKELYEKINYKDDSHKAVIVLESDTYPTTTALDYIARECEVAVSDVYTLVAPTSSMAGSVQISGRIVEAGIHKLTEVGFDPKKILYGCGSAPIAPIHPKAAKAMGRTNDAILYGGSTYYSVDFEDDAKLKELVSKAPSSTSRDYGRPFYDTFKAAGFDFYKIDPGLFAPAAFVVNNVRTGVAHTAGKINLQVLKQTMGLVSSQNPESI